MRRLSVLRPLLVLLLAFATQFQIGMMPAKGAEGGMVMVICSGEGPLMMVLDPATGAFRPAPPETRKSGCDWAGCGGFALQTPAPLPVFVPRLLGLGAETAATSWRPAHDPRGIWARGPPLSV